MFQQYKQSQQPVLCRQKQIFLIQNGSPNKIVQYLYKHSLSKQQVIRQCQKSWQIKYKSIRFFAIDGVQYDQEQLNLIKNKQRIYISKGEDFNQEMNFGQYKMLKPLGQGGFGKVMLAQNIITKQLAAVKILKVEKICGAQDIDMIFREIQNLKALNHPNIVKIINCYMLKNMQVYVVMQYLEGGQLLKFMRQKKRIDEEEAKNFFRQIVSAVCYCHRENIIHRDLKVQNILFKSKDDRTIKIADFGISGVADQFNPDFDAGTLKYMAPQVLSAKQKSNNPAVDVWACGVILYYMLYGFLPFTGNSNSQIIHVICEGKYTFPKQPYISPECKLLIEKILIVNPKKRIRMQQIREDPWLLTRHSKLRKQLSLKLQTDHILENDLILQNELSKSKIMKPNRPNEIQNLLDKKIKYERKSLHINKNQRKNTIVASIPKRLQKQKQQIQDQLMVFGVINKQGYGIANKQGHGIVNKQVFGIISKNSININQRNCQKRSMFRSNEMNHTPKSNPNYCSQQLPSIKDQKIKFLARVQSRQLRGSGSGGHGLPNSHLNSASINKREEKSIDRGDNRIKKKSTIIQNTNVNIMNSSGWK